MKLSIIGLTAVAALAVAGGASAQVSNVTVQQIGASPSIATVNLNRSISLGRTSVGATAIQNTVSVEGRDVNLGGPGWVSANTGIGGQNGSGNVVATTNVNLVAVGGAADVKTQAIVNNAEVDATGTVNVNNTLSQRAANIDSVATTNLSNSGFGARSDIGSVAVISNLNASGDRVNVGGTSTADLQIGRGNDAIATTNVSNSGFAGASNITSQAVINGASFNGYAVNYNAGQTTGLGDPWPMAQTSSAIATTNVSGALFGRAATIGSTGIQNTLSITGTDVNVNASQSAYGSLSNATTNVSLSGFSGVTSIGATSINNSISVRLP